MTRSHDSGRLLFAASLTIPLVLIFAGCASSTPMDAAVSASASPITTRTPTPSLTMPAPVPLSGHSAPDDDGDDAAMPIPAGARSVVVDFQCTGDSEYHVDLGNVRTSAPTIMLGLVPYFGRCGAAKELAWPISARTDGTLHVSIGANADWTAVPHFSTSEFVRDAAVTMDCKKFSWVIGELSDADNGYSGAKAFGSDEWRTRIDQAATELAAQSASSQSSLKASLTQLEPLLRDRSLKPGSSLSVAQPTITLVDEACTANQTEFVVQAHFGG